MEKYRRNAIIIIGFFEMLIFAGFSAGWPFIVNMLHKAEIYSHLCTKNSTENDRENLFNSTISLIKKEINSSSIVRCLEQEKIFCLVFTTMIFMNGIPSLFIGKILDKFGLRIVRIYASLMLTGGFIFLSFTNKENYWLIWPAFIMLGTGSNAIRLCSQQYPNLWPIKRPLILFAYSSANLLSALLFLIFQYMEEYEYSLQFSSLIVALFGLLILAFTLAFPCMRASLTDEKKMKATQESRQRHLEQLAKINKGPEEIETRKNSIAMYSGNLNITRKNPISNSIFTLSYFLHLYWSLVLFMLLYYSATFNSWVYRTTEDPEQIAFYNKILGFSLLVAPVLIPVPGLITDLLIKKAMMGSERIEILVKKYKAPSYPVMITSLFAIFISICKTFDAKSAIFISSFLFSISRPFFMGSSYFYIRNRFDGDHFKYLNEIVLTFVSFLSIGQYFIFELQYSSEEMYSIVNYSLIIFMVLTLSSPFHLLFGKWAKNLSKEQIQSRRESISIH